MQVAYQQDKQLCLFSMAPSLSLSQHHQLYASPPTFSLSGELSFILPANSYSFLKIRSGVVFLGSISL